MGAVTATGGNSENQIGGNGVVNDGGTVNVGTATGGDGMVGGYGVFGGGGTVNVGTAASGNGSRNDNSAGVFNNSSNTVNAGTATGNGGYGVYNPSGTVNAGTVTGNISGSGTTNVGASHIKTLTLNTNGGVGSVLSTIVVAASSNTTVGTLPMVFNPTTFQQYNWYYDQNQTQPVTGGIIDNTKIDSSNTLYAGYPGITKVLTPTANPSGGTVTNGATVALSCATPGAQIHYTLNGSDPAAGSPLYSAPIAIASGVTLKAIAIKSGMADSEILREVYMVDSHTPVITLPPDSTAWSNSMTVPVTVTDATGIRSVTYTTTGEANPQSGTVTLDPSGHGNITLANEGSYTLSVTAINSVGNSATKTTAVKFDKTAPRVTVSGNPASPVRSATLTVNAAAGLSGIRSVTVSKDNGPAQDITHSYQNGYPLTANGSYVFTVTNGTGVSVSSAPVVVTQIDKEKPIVSINSNGYQGGAWSNKDVVLNVSNIAQNLGTTSFEYSMDGTNWSPLNGGSITDSTEGVTNYSFRATSASGVVSDIQSITVKIDKTAPAGMAIGFKQNPFKTVAHFVTFGIFFGDTVNVNFSADDQGGSGVDHYQYQTVTENGTFNPSGAWQTGALSISPDYKGTIYARAVDKAGNVSGTVTKALVVDKTVPVITAQTSLATNDPNAFIPVEIKDNGAGVGTVTYQVNGGAAKTADLTSDAYSDLTKDYSLSIGSLPDGAYDVAVNAQDNSGNAAATAIVHVIKNAAQTGFGFTSGTLSKTYGDAPFTVTAKGGQGGAVTYAVTSGMDTLSVDAATGKATIKKAGTAVITATKAAGNGYSAATALMTVYVSKATPAVQTLPTASGISVIGKLSASSLLGGKASLPGTFNWANPDTVVTQSGSYDVTFIPTDSDDYNTVPCKAALTVTPLLTGGGSNAQLDFTGVTLPAGVTSVSLESSVQSGNNSTCSVVAKLIGQNQTLGSLSGLTVYVLKLLDQNGNPIENFTGKIKVKIPIPAGMSGNLKIFWYNPADGTLTDMNATQENGYLVFETSHFSYYAIAQLESASPVSSSPVQNPKTGSGNWLLFPLAVLGGSAATGAVIVKRRRLFRIKKKA